MAILLTCTGRKKPISKVVDFMVDLEKSSNITILANKQVSRKLAFWKYEELKLLFLSHKSRVKIDKKLLKGLDFASMEKKETVTIKWATFESEDDWVKVNILSQVGGFQMSGGRININEVVKDGANQYSKKRRTCHVIMVGPHNLSKTTVDALVKQKMADPASVEYIL